ncbi:MAG: hypothetical protein L3J88_13400 [Gammaproteobacteria bacterium]|nr:hypothetical protein [Gammaproteobacteria bacterium]MCF6364309.1 hypothetical protein [Gammaproteobacteria bacterium]
MKKINKFKVQFGLVVFLMLAVNVASAASSIQIHNGSSPVWCFGMNQFDRCTLYLGTEESCENLNPCIKGSVSSINPSSEEVFFCMGEDDVTGECTLLLGSEKSCNNITKCSSVNKQLPRAPEKALMR